MSTVVWDIETVPLPIAELTAAIPPFDPEAVKYGNAKDPEKRAAILANAEARHRTDFIENAALDPRTGRIKVAGFRDVDRGVNTLIIHSADHVPFGNIKDTQLNVFEQYHTFLSAISMRIMSALSITSTGSGGIGTGRLMGYYIHDFDLPFLFQSCWMNGIPANVRHYRRGRYWNDNIVDLRETWCFGDRYAATGGLDGLGKLVGAKTRKTGDGKNFHILWDQDPKAALEYLIGDLMQTEEIGRAIGEI